MPYEDRHDADDESIASDDVGELDNGLDELDIFKRREEEKPAKSLMTEQEKNVTEGSAITQQIEIFDKMIKFYCVKGDFMPFFLLLILHSVVLP